MFITETDSASLLSINDAINIVRGGSLMFGPSFFE